MLPREQRFSEGEPCPVDGTTQRYRGGGRCVACAKKACSRFQARKRRGRVPLRLTQEQRRVSRDVLRSLGQDQRQVPLLESDSYVLHLPDLGDD